MDDELREIIEDLGIQKTADMLGIHRTTVLRWTRYQTKPPANTKRFLSAAMGKLWGKWQGWVIDRDGDLYAPTNERFEPEDLYVRRWHLQLIKAQRKEIKDLEAKLERISRAGAGAANDAAVPNAIGLGELHLPDAPQDRAASYHQPTPTAAAAPRRLASPAPGSGAGAYWQGIGRAPSCR